MVTEIFTPEMAEDGRTLLRALDAAELKVTAAFWFWMSEQFAWRIIIATPLTDQVGPLEIYRQIERVLRKERASYKQLTFGEVVVLSPNDSLVSMMVSAVNTRPGTMGVRFSRNTVNGQFIEDAYIYRMMRPAEKSTSRGK